jgi:hypothetical protein
MFWNKSWILMLGIFFVWGSAVLHADDVAVVFLKGIKGAALIRSLGEPGWHLPRQGMTLEETTEIRVGLGAEVVIWLDNDEASGKISMADKGVFRFAQIRREGTERKTLVELGSGTLMVQGDKRRKTSGLEIKTPTGHVAVKDAAMRITVK